jgi:hypothetical protein
MNAIPERITRDTAERRLRALSSGGVGPGLPRRRADRWILLAAAARALPTGELAERALNQHLKAWLSDAGPRVVLDHVSLRRALVDEGFVERDSAGARYRVSRAHERRVVFEP